MNLLPDMWENMELKLAKEEVKDLRMHVFNCIWIHPYSWPLFYPLDPKRLSDYYPVAKNPVDILVVKKRQLFDNWRIFKNVYSLYKVLANKMEVYMFEILKMDLKAIDCQKRIKKG